jgi:hypothetical protein
MGLGSKIRDPKKNLSRIQGSKRPRIRIFNTAQIRILIVFRGANCEKIGIRMCPKLYISICTRCIQNQIEKCE